MFQHYIEEKAAGRKKLVVKDRLARVDDDGDEVRENYVELESVSYNRKGEAEVAVQEVSLHVAEHEVAQAQTAVEAAQAVLDDANELLTDVTDALK